GAEEGIRTPDPHLGKVMLYRAELLPRPRAAGTISRRCGGRQAVVALGAEPAASCLRGVPRPTIPPSVNVLVHKYGGTSMNGPERIRAVAKSIAAARDAGHAMVVVV